MISENLMQRSICAIAKAAIMFFLLCGVCHIINGENYLVFSLVCGIFFGIGDYISNSNKFFSMSKFKKICYMLLIGIVILIIAFAVIAFFGIAHRYIVAVIVPLNLSFILNLYRE